MLISRLARYQIDHVPSPGQLYSSLMDLIVMFASHGLIHGDFNEFNLLIANDDIEQAEEETTESKEGDATTTKGKDEKEEEEGVSTRPLRPIVIDFPQMVSTSHVNAKEYFERDVECIKRFFRKRFHYESTKWPIWEEDVLFDGVDEELDKKVAASGYNRKQDDTLTSFIEANQTEGNEEDHPGSEEDQSESEEDHSGSEEENSEEDDSEEIIEEEGHIDKAMSGLKIVL